jgi:hypothetical protein
LKSEGGDLSLAERLLKKGIDKITVIEKNIKNAEEEKLIICTGKYVQEIKDQIIKINSEIQILTNEYFLKN